MNLSLVQGRWEVSSEVCWPGVGMMWPSLMFVQEKEGSEDRGGCIRQGMCFLTIYFFVTGAFFYGWLSLATLISSHWKTRGLIRSWGISLHRYQSHPSPAADRARPCQTG